MHTSDKRAGRRLALFIGCLTIIGLLSAGDRAMVAGADPTAAAGGIHKESAASRSPITNAVQTPDPNTLLLLRFDNSLNGAQGETPTQAAGVSFQPGISGQGAFLPAGAQLHYASAGNLNAKEGTIEFWVKPNWNGNDGQSRTFMYSAGDGTIRIGKDGANNFGLSFWNVPQVAVDINLSQWSANLWRHVAFTWSDQRKRLRLYVNGVLMRERSFTASLPSSFPPSFQIGAEIDSNYLDAILDEFRVSDVERTADEIGRTFLAGVTLSSLSMQITTPEMFVTWKQVPRLTANSNMGVINVPPGAANWTSSDASVAAVDSSGQITALSAGNATITATLQGIQATVNVTALAPVKAPEFQTIDPYLATPAANSLYVMPVVIVRYLPTKDGVNLDTSWSPPDFGTITVSALKSNLDRYEKWLKYMLEEGSKFRGYKDATARPSLGYKVVAIINVYEPTPPGKVMGYDKGYPIYIQNFHQIFERWDIKRYVNDLGVKEVWHWDGGLGPSLPAYNPAIHFPWRFRSGWESNMSSPITGDISNSDRDPNDLPVYNNTYVVYSYNISRTNNEMAHDHGHQLESILSAINSRQDGNTTIFWNQFAGRNLDGSFQKGRCGDTHHPPNADSDYDYYNPTPVLSDIEDWTPARTGQLKSVSKDTWGNIPYVWPDNTPFLGNTEAKWYVYWMQNMPGRDNVIPHGGNRMTNWWHFTADWDAAVRAGVGLYEPASCNYSISATSQFVANGGGSGNINVACDNGCKWIASSNEPWIKITSGKTSNGNGAVSFTVDANTGASRIGTIAIAGQVFTVTQSASIQCVYTLSAANQNFTSSGGAGSVDVTTTSGCAWTAISNAPWITISTGGSGNGNGTVNFSVTANAGQARTGTLTIAEQTFTVTQAAKPANTPPTIIAEAPLSVRRGVFTEAKVVTVSDNETPAGDLTVTAIALPPGVSIPTEVNGAGCGLWNAGGAVYSCLIVNCQAALGPNRITLRVTDGDGATATTDFTINVTDYVAPVLGNYPATVRMVAGSAARVSPDAPPGPFGNNLYPISSLTVSSQNFTGPLRVDDVTGQVFIAEATQPGSYPVNVTMTDFCGVSLTRSFNLIVTAPASFACSSPFPALSASYPVNGTWRSIVTGDFNGDGRTDIANGAAVMLNDGSGGFGQATSYPVQGSVRSSAASDLNGDGKTDLALITSLNSSSQLAILLANNSGGFDPAVNYPLESTLNLAIADFDGNQRPDIVVTTRDGASVLFNNGAGRFNQTRNFTVGRTQWYLAAGDFNGDGKQDIVLPIDGGHIALLLGNGDGSFASPIKYGSPIGSFSSSINISAGDLNGDGKTDLIVPTGLARTGENSPMAVLMGDAAGFSPVSYEYTVLEPFIPAYSTVAIGDFNNDGKADILNKATLLFGEGDGRFSPASDTGLPAYRHFAAGDFNGDGKDDLVFGATNEVIVKLSNCSAPTIQASGVTISQGGPDQVVTIAKVADAETPVGKLTVTASSVPVGVTITNIANNNGTVTAKVSAACNATVGANDVTLTVDDGAGRTTTSVFTVNVVANAAPILGNYPAIVQLNTGAGTAVAPGAPPADNYTVSSVTSTAPGFAGTLSVNPATGVVTVVNAGPAGDFVVTVTATDNCGATTTRSFNLAIRYATATSLASSANPSVIGQPVNLTATVGLASAGQVTPIGTVTFKDGATTLGTSALNNGAAVFTAGNLAAGAHAFTAVYNGQANFLGSASTPFGQMVNNTPPGGNVVLQTTSGTTNISVKFASVTTGGVTTVTSIAPSAVPGLPSAYAIFGANNYAFEIQTTASYTAPVTVCFSLPAVNDQTVFDSLSVLHGENGVLVDRTSSRDFASRTICAQANSLSPFVIARSLLSPVGPGLAFPATAASDQKAGSVLIYNIFTSNATDAHSQNTRINLTNIHPARSVAVHLFFVDGGNCSVADSYICLSQNQTASFLAADLDPGTSGYLIAVAVDEVTGCPINFNFLIGDEMVKFDSGHAANLGAEAFAALGKGLPVCDSDSIEATLKFDGVSYEAAPRALALSNILARPSGNDTLMILNRFGGNLADGAATLGSIFGLLYDDTENGFSFTFNLGVCQFRNTLSNSFPRTAPRIEQIIPAGRSGWMKLWPESDAAILGAAINFNPNAGSGAGAFNQGHNLHKLTLTGAASLTIPVFAPSCQ